MPFNYDSFAKKQKAQSVHVQNWFSFILVISFVGDLYVHLILFYTWLTYTDYYFSSAVWQLKNNMCSCIIKLAYQTMQLSTNHIVMMAI